ncbi:Alpha/Beta hydrolase protein [Coprinopsis sp. MPI-PUGE-AT-0042]|nr:Alpha/Beta hydrolase protein [Coprinopsis sp. MPI-PUGE-AT-0042]
MGFFSKFVTTLTFVASIPLSAFAGDVSGVTSPVLAGPIDKHCVEGAKYEGTATGKNTTIAGVPTYVAKPSVPGKNKRVILFFPDVYGPFYENNFLLQDHFASKGYHVLGIDYFLGDPLGNHSNEPGFNMTAWITKSRTQAREVLPKWIDAVRGEYGSTSKYSAVGYCFGGPYAIEAAATDWISAAAFAHPADVTEAHVLNVTKPLLMSCAETDSTFPAASRRRAVDILVEKKATYHHQLFSGVSHGFATRADPADKNAVWAKNESARSVLGWFDRFTL